MHRTFDKVCKHVLPSNFFANGWGSPDSLRRIFEFRKIISKRDSCMELVSENHPIEIVKETEHGDHIVLQGQFTSPAVNYLNTLIPEESKIAKFQMILPKKWGSLKPVCLHLAGTGDHGFWRRKILTAKPLLQETGISSILLENPFYGCRKPKEQTRSNLLNVSDLFIMGMSLILESIAIFHWAERQGFGPLGISGISMGGHMASLAASIWPKPLALTPCLSWSTASHVFTQGVMSNAINWQLLKKQYFSNKVFREELFNMIESPEGDFRIFHEVGQEFDRNVPPTLTKVDKLRNSIAKMDETPKNSFSNTLKFIKALPIPKLKKKDFIFDKSTPVLPRPNSARHSPAVEFKPYVPVKDAPTWEALQFMRGIMDECTHLGNFPVPVDPSLIIIVAALNDAYVPNEGTIPLTDIWPGAELRKINNGHISAFLFQQQFFRNAIKDCFDRTVKKYYNKDLKIGTNCHDRI